MKQNKVPSEVQTHFIKILKQSALLGEGSAALIL